MKTKENKGSLYLVIVLTLAILMLFGISTQSVLAETKENIEEELEILSAYDSIVVDGETIDMTEYKEKTLPDEPMENIDSGNIDEYVPKELFNRGSEPIIYCGNHYGFVIQEDSRTNTVLLFKIETRPMTEYDDGYYVKVAVVFEKSFLMVWNNITPLATLNHLAIGVNGVQQTILDDQIGVTFAEYKPEQDTGPFLIEFDYGSLATEVESGDFFEGMKSYMIDFVVDSAVAAISAAVPGAGPALNVAVALGTIAGESASKFVVHNNKNNEYVFPKNREDQLNSPDTNYTLLKSYEADVINSDEFFLTYNDNQMNYLEMSFHINNPLYR